MKRFMWLEGVAGCLLVDHTSSDPLRMVAQQRLSLADREGKKKRECYAPIKQVCEWHPYLVKAVSKGMLVQHGPNFTAESLQQATETKSKTKSKAPRAKASKPKGGD